MREITIDLFAGGGGASSGIEQALGMSVDIAINHDPEAIEMHKANHPGTVHYTEDVFKVNPLEVVANRPVGLLWASPDCTHFSRAKGGKPVKKEIRSLAWVVIHWAQLVRPRVIMLENVPEFKTWGPLDESGQPDKSKMGKTFNLWSNQLRGLGYDVQFKVLSAADYGTPTIRTRLFMVARCDGQPIIWPEPTHSEADNLFGLKPYRTASECIDWSIPCPSIFTRKKPLVEATLRRIAKGLKKFIIDNPKPFILGIDNQSSPSGVWPISEPLRTITLENRFALVTPFLSKYFSGVVGSGLNKPTPTVTAIDHNALVMPFLTKYHGRESGEGRGQRILEPLRVQDTQNRFGLVSAFLIKYYGCGFGQSVQEPAHTITSKDRLGLVMVQGEAYRLADIGLRMLQPRELATAQGFADNYILTGSKSCQVAKIGNSVCPPMAKALVKANVCLEEIKERMVG